MSKRNISVERLDCRMVAEQAVEIVERKGVGHPDSICDGIMEEVSLALTREYERRFGTVFHYNVDKSLLVAGEVEHRFGGGRVTQPMKMIFGDRATFEVDGQQVPVGEIAIDSAKAWLRRHLPQVDPDQHVEYQVEIKKGAPELATLFDRPKGLLGANDTSAAVGYAPLTDTERLVLETEFFLNGAEFKKEFPETGQDVKVMGFRIEDCLHLTIAMPLLDRYVDSEASYFRRKKEILSAVEEHLDKERGGLSCIKIYHNTLDNPSKGLEGMYLTVTGTSAEDSDSGQVGRGNRVNGIISLSRPASAEAAPGKNAASHVGKIYGVLSHRIADKVYREVPGLKDVYIWLCSQIGAPVDRPLVAAGQVILEPGIQISSVANKVEEIMDRELAGIGSFIKELAQGQYRVY